MIYDVGAMGLFHIHMNMWVSLIIMWVSLIIERISQACNGTLNDGIFD